MARRFDKYWLVAALIFGVFVMPLLVYATGVKLLGPYAGGGAGAFFGDFLGDLVTFHWYAWALALGPLVILGICVGMWRLASPRHDLPPSARKAQAERIEPRLNLP